MRINDNNINFKEKKEIKIGNTYIGKNHNIKIQSMCNIKTSDVSNVIKQINSLENIGCDIIRVSILDETDAKAIQEIKKHINIPIVADIHFDYKLAVAAIENGADKIRINPGNIKDLDKVLLIINKAKEFNIPIRIGVNSGSIDKDILKKYHNIPSVQAMIESMDKYVKFFEENNFYNIVLSIKTTSYFDTIEVNKKLNELYDYPIHIGLTESGTEFSGVIKSSYVLGNILNLGIGDTIRVSLNGKLEKEIETAKEILAMQGLYHKINLIACPTCGRCQYDSTTIVHELEDWINRNHFNKKLTVAVMGCAVNGPGEAFRADIGIAGGNHEVVLFKHGKIIKKIKEENVLEELKKEILLMLNS